MNKEYIEEIEDLLKKLPQNIIHFSLSRESGNIPTQAYSEFLTNREQGDWAEYLIFKAVNEINNNIIAIKYGTSNQIIAGEQGFNEFYKKYQYELSKIGKRPDLLIFKKECFNLISDISYELPETMVSKAVAGLEIRSSSFLVQKYTEFFIKRRNEIKKQIDYVIRDINEEISVLPNNWRVWLSNVDLEKEETLFSIPNPRKIKSDRIKDMVKKLRSLIESLKKRDFLSFTIKAEDIGLIYRWIKTYGVPHYYIQVFFDQVYAISFKEILETISDPAKKGKIFFVEKNSKNQFKTTFHININQGILIAEKIDFPAYTAKYKELERGRLLFYVTFEKGKAYLDFDKFYNLIGVQNENK